MLKDVLIVSLVRRRRRRRRRRVADVVVVVSSRTKPVDDVDDVMPFSPLNVVEIN